MKKPAQLRILLIHFFSLLLALLSACSNRNEGGDKPLAQRNARQSESWIKEAIIARVELAASTKGITFRGLQQELPEMKKSGFTVLWLSPVFPSSSLNQSHQPGDPFPVRDYYDVQDDFGSLDDFKAFVRTAHGLGLKIICDFVATYTAWDSKLVFEHPDWFRTNEEGAIISPNSEVTDVAELNFGHHELRKYMIEAMKFWVRDVGVDGLSFHRAEGVPLDFWVRARKELEKIRPVVIIAQSDTPEHHLEAFDVTYSTDARELPGQSSDGSSMVLSFGNQFVAQQARFPLGSLRFHVTRQVREFPQKISDTVAS
ncbi:MAG: alpha-amylase family glycosyl hydrolase, partial [Bacteroidota bacterium]